GPVIGASCRVRRLAATVGRKLPGAPIAPWLPAVTARRARLGPPGHSRVRRRSARPPRRERSAPHPSPSAPAAGPRPRRLRPGSAQWPADRRRLPGPPPPHCRSRPASTATPPRRDGREPSSRPEALRAVVAAAAFEDRAVRSWARWTRPRPYLRPGTTVD